jgi:hypothetical protein
MRGERHRSNHRQRKQPYNLSVFSPYAIVMFSALAL